MTHPEGRYRVEHYDHSWGGWRPVPVSWEDDTPFRTDMLEEAALHLKSLRSQTRVFKYRIYDTRKCLVSYT